MHIFKVFLMTIVYWILGFFIKKEKNSIVFGSWRGESFTDNSRYMAEYIGANYPQYKLYWVGKEKIKEEVNNASSGLIFLEMGRFNTNIQIMKCSFCFVSQKYHVDISRYPLVRNTTLVYLHHGTAIKKWGDDGLNKKKAVTLMERLHDRFTCRIMDYNYYASSSRLMSEVFCTAMASNGCTLDKILCSGTPRNDMLVNFDIKRAMEYKDKYFNIFNIKGNPKIILYLPTYRRLDSEIFSFGKLTNNQASLLSSILEEYNAVIIEKSHFVTKEGSNQESNERIIFSDKQVNVQEILMFTDILISDYSSVILDFVLLNRPIINFVYDYEYYRDSDSGLYYEIEEYHAGAIAKDFNGLIDALKNELSGDNCYEGVRRKVRDVYMEYEQGDAAEQIFNKVIKANS